VKYRTILGMVISVSLLMNTITYTYYDKQLDEQLTIAQETESILQTDIETKSTEIAKLGSVIKTKDKTINQQISDIKELEAELKSLKEAELREKIQQEQERKRQEEIASQKAQTITVEASAYTAFCNEGCTGRTATGVNVADSIYYKGHRVIAVDTDVIPLNSLVRVETDGKVFTAMAIDTGGAIDGHKIDLLVGNTKEAIQFGRKEAKLTILEKGE
jgi:3D (Asp-Asp-Asp) domain-containing protein